MTKKIVVTGIGASSPVGGTAPDSWTGLLAGESGAHSLTQSWVAELDLPVTFAAEAKVRPDEVLERIEIKRLDPVSQFALISSREAWADAGSPEIAPERLGVEWATGIGGLWTLLDAWDTLKEKGPRRVLPMTVPMLMPNAAAAAVSMSLNARAFARTDVSACASSTESIANAYDHLQAGYADIIVAGGSESCIHGITLASFASMQALSKRNDDPATASRPYDVTRDGFVMGEGAAALVLETEEHALARGAHIYAEIVGYGATSDGYDMVAPSGEGAIRCMQMAMSTVDAPIDYLNTHGTSTPVGDVAEIKGVREVFAGKAPAISSTKSLSGHSLGAAGVHEAIYCMLMMEGNFIAGSANIDELDPAVADLPIQTVTKENVELNTVMSNSFGFGGTNATLVLQRWQGK
jgi:3-oxoacyl-[acyl-carrier-protein] synthase II